MGRLRSPTLEELRNEVDLPDPKRLRSQIRGTLALLLSEALDMGWKNLRLQSVAKTKHFFLCTGSGTYWK